MKNKILVLGASGMLGNAVLAYLRSKKCHVIGGYSRYPNRVFINYISKYDIIINCLGAVPRNSKEFGINVAIPHILSQFPDIKCIQPASSIYFPDDLCYNKAHSKTIFPSVDTPLEDGYANSKLLADYISLISPNIKLIRTSLLGFDFRKTGILSNFLNSNAKYINGYSNHFWNGITTLEWAKMAYKIIHNWDNCDKIIQLATSFQYSNYDILQIFRDIFQKDVNIVYTTNKKSSNRCLTSDFKLKSLEEQLDELKKFYNYKLDK